MQHNGVLSTPIHGFMGIWNIFGQIVTGLGSTVNKHWPVELRAAGSNSGRGHRQCWGRKYCLYAIFPAREHAKESSKMTCLLVAELNSNNGLLRKEIPHFGLLSIFESHHLNQVL